MKGRKRNFNTFHAKMHHFEVLKMVGIGDMKHYDYMTNILALSQLVVGHTPFIDFTSFWTILSSILFRKYVIESIYSEFVVNYLLLA